MNQKANEKLDNNIEIKKEERQLAASGFRVYEYFKRHPSVLFATTSAFVAVISLVLNFAAFLSNNSYLMYFRVDNVVYKSTAQFIYLVEVALLFLTVFILFQSFLSKTFDNYLPYKRKLLLYKYHLKKIKKDIEYGKKERRLIRKTLIETYDFVANDNKKAQIEKKLEQLSKSAKEIECEYKSIRKEIVKWCIIQLALLALSCVLVWCVMTVASFLLFSVASYEWDKILNFSMFYSVFLVMIGTLENWFLSCVLKLNRKKIKADSKLDKTETLHLYNDLPEFPISSILNGEFKLFFSDRNCKRFVVTIIFILALIVMVFSWAGAKSAKNQKEFFVTDINNETYVLIYNNGETVVLEKAVINGNNIIIDTTHQKIIASSDLEIKKYQYDFVDIIRTRKNNIGEEIESIETSEVPEMSEAIETSEVTETSEATETSDATETSVVHETTEYEYTESICIDGGS